MGPGLVVVGAGPLKLALELDDAARPALFGEPLLQAVVGALCLATGLGVIGPGVLVGDAQGDQLEPDGAGPLAALRGEDGAVAGQHRGR